MRWRDEYSKYGSAKNSKDNKTCYCGWVFAKFAPLLAKMLECCAVQKHMDVKAMYKVEERALAFMSWNASHE